jgi:hypothetical protein
LAARHTRVYSIPIQRPQHHFYDDIPTSLAERVFPKLADARRTNFGTRWPSLRREIVVLQNTTLTHLLSDLAKSTWSGQASQSSNQQSSSGNKLRQGNPPRLSRESTAAAPNIARTSLDAAKNASNQQQTQPIVFLSADIASNESAACAVNLGPLDRFTFRNLRDAYKSLPSWKWKQATGIKFYRVPTPARAR